MNVKKPTEQEINETKNWGEWSKEPSSFPWYYDEKETCYILEGKASVKDKQGNTISFEKGDWVEFESGLECTWHIAESVRKKYKLGD